MPKKPTAPTKEFIKQIIQYQKPPKSSNTTHTKEIAQMAGSIARPRGLAAKDLPHVKVHQISIPVSFRGFLERQGQLALSLRRDIVTYATIALNGCNTLQAKVAPGILDGIYECVLAEMKEWERDGGIQGDPFHFFQLLLGEFEKLAAKFRHDKNDAVHYYLGTLRLMSDPLEIIALHMLFWAAFSSKESPSLVITQFITGKYAEVPAKRAYKRKLKKSDLVAMV